MTEDEFTKWKSAQHEIWTASLCPAPLAMLGSATPTTAPNESAAASRDEAHVSARRSPQRAPHDRASTSLVITSTLRYGEPRHWFFSRWCGPQRVLGPLGPYASEAEAFAAARDGTTR